MDARYTQAILERQMLSKLFAYVYSVRAIPKKVLRCGMDNYIGDSENRALEKSGAGVGVTLFAESIKKEFLAHFDVKLM